MKERLILAGQFKAHCLQLMDEVQRQRVPIVITKRGKPVARLLPIEHDVLPLFGYMEGTALIKGDLIAPVGEPWEAHA